MGRQGGRGATMANGRRGSRRRKYDNPQLPSTAAPAFHINRRPNRRPPADPLKIPAVRSSNHSPPQQQADHHPWLLFSHDRDFKRQTFCSIDGMIHHRRSIPELRNKTVEFSGSGGWLVLLDCDSDGSETHLYSLWNLSTYETIVLPPLKLNPDFSVRWCILTSSPGTTGAMICLFESDTPRVVFLSLSGRRQAWNEIGLQKQLQNLGLWEAYSEQGKCYFYVVACCDGVIHVVTNHCQLFQLCNNDKDPNNKLLLRPLNITMEKGEMHSICSHTSLVSSSSSGGELFSVVIYKSGVSFNEFIAIEVFRLNFDLMEWERVVNSKDRTFFVGDAGSFACPASCDAEGGKLYFAINGDRNIYSYDIERRRLSIAYRSPKLPSPRSNPIWVMPMNRLIDDVKLMKDAARKGKRETQKEEGEIVGPVIVNTPRDTDVAKETNLLHLPKEIIELIARRLIFLDYMNFRKVCKAFMSAAPAIEGRKTSFGTNSLSPWLVFPGKDREVLNFIDPEFSGQYLVSIPTETEDGRICYSKDGWLLMSKDMKSMFFFNPFTREVLPCPNLSPGVEIYSFIFSSAPTSSECVIVGLSHGFEKVGMHILHFGSEDWFYSEYQTGIWFEANRNTPAFWEGDFYFLGQEGNLFRIKIGDPCYCEILGKLRHPCNSYHQNFLVECDKELLSVFVGVAGKWVRVFRFNIPCLAWEEVYTLGKHALYLSRSSAIAVVARCKKMENRIYFPRLQGESMAFYSLYTRKFHSSHGDESWMDYIGTSEQLLCGWIEPRWSNTSTTDQCSS